LAPTGNGFGETQITVDPLLLIPTGIENGEGTTFFEPNMSFAQMQSIPAPQVGQSVRVAEFHYAPFTWNGHGWVSTSPLQLMNMGIPFVVLPDSTYGNNGVVTVGTALPEALPAGFFYVPADSISASNAAGWYYGIMSTSTALQLYNNPYPNPTTNITGDPDESVPISLGGKSSQVLTSFTGLTGQGAVAQVTTPIQAVNYTTIPAGLFNVFGGIQYNLFAERGNTSATSGAEIVCQIGTTKVFDVALNAAKVTNIYALRSCLNIGNVKAQLNPPIGQAGPSLSTGATPNLYTAIDFSVAQNFAVYLTIPSGGGEYYICNGLQLDGLFS
jgi:hypothetical protein